MTGFGKFQGLWQSYTRRKRWDVERGMSWHGLCLLSPLPVTWAGSVAWRGCCVGQNNPLKAEGDRRKLHRETERGVKMWLNEIPVTRWAVGIILVTSCRVFALARLSLLRECCSGLLGYLSSSPIWLMALDRKRLIVISVLSLLISWVKPLSGPCKCACCQSRLRAMTRYEAQTIAAR